VPSSILFAALSVAWLAVLVPMFARRRQEVSRTTDTALAARVVRRGSADLPVDPKPDVREETPELLDDGGDAIDADPDLYDEYQTDSQGSRVHAEDVRAGRRYRPGRGGFDPEAAALAARAKYARRQRIVLLMLFLAITAALVAALAWPLAWWLHGCMDLLLAGYLTYLRRQVRIEEDVRNRRLARLAGARETADPAEHDVHDDDDEEEVAEQPRQSAATPARTHVAHNAAVVEIDDEDPVFDELDERTWEPYQRAAGE
jgi:membrane protein implicated in regulation of membrane protease activity